MGDAAIRVEGVSKRFRIYHDRNKTLKGTLLQRRRARYEDFWALDDVTFEITEGTTFALVGENGSGKSTLLKCIARILRPERGAIEVRGTMSALLELGAGFHPELSGRENVYLNASILGMSKREVDRRFDDIVAFAGLERFIDTPVKNYSSGMYVRLGFSVATTVEPDVLLVDEVLAVGDQDFQQRCMEKFGEFKRAGRTIVLVTHGMEAVRNFCDGAALLEQGRLKVAGTGAEVVEAYLGKVLDQRRARAAEEDAREAATRRGPLRGAELLDADGEHVVTTQAGQLVRFRFHVDPAELPEPLRLTFNVYRSDGILMWSTNSGEAVPPGGPPITFDYEVPSLPLGTGDYVVEAVVENHDLTQEWDRNPRAVRFAVEAGPWRWTRGPVDPVGAWGVHEPS